MVLDLVPWDIDPEDASKAEKLVCRGTLLEARTVGGLVHDNFGGLGDVVAEGIH